MARSFNLVVRGAGGVVANLRQYPEDVKANVRVVMRRSMERAYAIAAANCPYDVLELDDFHMIDVLRQEMTEAELGYFVGFLAKDFREAGQPPYYLFTEYGTIKMRAQPCIGPAREQETPRLRRELKGALRTKATKQRAA